MSIWISIIITGLINYLTRLGSVLFIKPQKLNNTLKTVLNYVPPRQAPKYNPNQENLIITWDILMHGYRTINCDTVDLISTLEADETFWTYISEKISPMSAQEKMNFIYLRIFFKIRQHLNQTN